MPLIISPRNGSHLATASLDGQGFEVRLGKGGLFGLKREGDRRSPRGAYFLEYGLYRPDRMARPRTKLPMVALSQQMGWCDDPGHHAYNTLVDLPFPASHEKLWREDGLYDLIVVISHNRTPPVKGRGSAIFLHCMGDNKGPTHGCAAFPKAQLLHVISRLEAGSLVLFGTQA